jgi:hypothetical protein
MSRERYETLPESLVLGPPRDASSVILVTTLLDAELYTAEALADHYLVRWRVEQNLKRLKQTIKIDVLECMTPKGVLKERTVYGLVFILVRVVILEAASLQGVDVERISVIDALRWLGQLKRDKLPKRAVNPA